MRCLSPRTGHHLDARGARALGSTLAALTLVACGPADSTPPRAPPSSAAASASAGSHDGSAAARPITSPPARADASLDADVVGRDLDLIAGGRAVPGAHIDESEHVALQERVDAHPNRYLEEVGVRVRAMRDNRRSLASLFYPSFLLQLRKRIPAPAAAAARELLPIYRTAHASAVREPSTWEGEGARLAQQVEVLEMVAGERPLPSE